MRIERISLTTFFTALSILFVSNTRAQDVTSSGASSAFKGTFQTRGRGICEMNNGVLKTKDAYASFGDENMSDYEATFRACTPKEEEQVQLWAGFREFNRNDRYIIGLRGGSQNTMYLSRLGYLGTDEFLALRSLDFKPQPGTWYTFRVQVVGKRIRVFLNDEVLPRIDIEDKNSVLAPAGKITLGGGWISSLYEGLQIVPLQQGSLDNIPKLEYAAATKTIDKAAKRKQERNAYKAVVIDKINPGRTVVSLDGQWLFMPVYEMADQKKAISPKEDDKEWHSMHVPDFWNPIRIWLHGETFGPFAKGASDNYFQAETDRCEGYTFDYKKTAAAWYRQWVELPSDIEGKDVALQFDAISKIAEVWVNGVHAGKHVGMFGDLNVNAKGLFHKGKNLVTVKVIRDYTNDIKDEGKVIDVAVSVEVTNKMLKDLAHGFYNGDPAGIWQPVKLVITDPVKISDVYIKPTLTGASFEITVKNSGKVDKQFTFATNIADKNGKQLYSGQALPNTIVRAGEERTFNYSVNDLKPLLWTPQTPNLYDFAFCIMSNGKVVDSSIIVSGFRTFESKDGYLWLNGKRYWLRGGNQTPFALAPNDIALADKFYDLMKAGNMEVTRTHTAPYNELWMQEADKKGIGVSFEGTWPWLMLASSMPDKKLIDMWADEFLAMIKKYRNHPSLLFWTVNNEMKFYDNDPDMERAKLKMTIISDVVKRMRTVDNTRPICFDSNYKRKGKAKKFGETFFSSIDDGDIDDIHSYINWYDHTVFKQFNGEFQKENWTEGRPLISQEMSTGYPNSETGHPVRFYTQVHQTPQSLVGDLAYEYNDPAYFLQAQSFITSEVAEALRRSNDKSAGIIHFALITWFQNVYNASTIKPYGTYYAMQRALEPVLVSAELWGRHFYTGEQLPVRICIVNDRSEGSAIAASELEWKLVSNDGKVLQTGTQKVPSVAYYGREWVTPTINIAALPQDRINGKLVLSLKENGKQISSNEYAITLANKQWNKTVFAKKILLVDKTNMKAVFDGLGIAHILSSTVSDALQQKADIYVFSGVNSGDVSTQDLQRIKEMKANGARFLLLNSGFAADLFPEYIKGSIIPTEGDIVNIDIPESPVFNGIELMDLRYFNNNKREVPTVCNSALKVVRNEHVELLAKHIKIHGYINGDMAERAKYMQSIEGSTIIKINDKGTAIISTMALEKGLTDPVAGKLLVNMLNDLTK